MITALLITAALSVFTTATHAEVNVQPIGLSIGSPSIEEMDFGLRPNGVNAGTSVHLLVSGLDKPIVMLDDDNSTLHKVTDSTGKDLLQEKPQQDGGFMSFSSGPIGPFPKISDDGKQLILDMTAPQTPAAGATSITFEGTLSVVVAAGTKAVSAQGVAAKPGAVKLGEHSVQITGYGPSDWEEGKMKLELKMTAELLDAISAWKITAPDGTELFRRPELDHDHDEHRPARTDT